MTEFTLDSSAPMQPARMTRLLNILLKVGMVLLGVFFCIWIACTLIMITPNTLRDQLFSGVSAEANINSPISLAIACAGGAVTTAAWFFVLSILRKVVGTMIAGEPFIEDNIKRLRWMWIVIAGAEVFRMIIHFMTAAPTDGAGSAIDIRIGTWFLVFIFAVLAETYRYGAEMRREQELTI